MSTSCSTSGTKVYYTGSRGGKYWLDDKGKKHYVSQKKKAVTKTPTVKQVNTRKTYIGYYYVLDSDGYRVDDFKEWCDAYSAQEAEEEFRDRYWRQINKGSIELSMVCARK